MTLSISPDGRHLAFVALERKGAVVDLMDLQSGRVRELVETETGCKAGWASATTLWVSRRRDGNVIWTEVDAESGRETGKSVPGLRDCTDGRPDPQSPVDPDVRVVYEHTAQLRLIDREHWPRH